TITGTGGNSSGSNNYGINQAAAITNTGAGSITLNGTGGGPGSNEAGYAGSFPGPNPSNITAVTGNISITGMGSSTSTGVASDGIDFYNGAISTTGGGTITLA